MITLDLDLYKRALQIQQSVGNSNWVGLLLPGTLHVAFAALHALGKTLNGSDLIPVPLMLVPLPAAHAHLRLYAVSMKGKRTKGLLSTTL